MIVIVAVPVAPIPTPGAAVVMVAVKVSPASSLGPPLAFTCVLTLTSWRRAPAGIVKTRLTTE